MPHNNMLQSPPRSPASSGPSTPTRRRTNKFRSAGAGSGPGPPSAAILAALGATAGPPITTAATGGGGGGALGASMSSITYNSRTTTTTTGSAEAVGAAQSPVKVSSPRRVSSASRLVLAATAASSSSHHQSHHSSSSTGVSPSTIAKKTKASLMSSPSKAAAAALTGLSSSSSHHQHSKLTMMMTAGGTPLTHHPQHPQHPHPQRCSYTRFICCSLSIIILQFCVITTFLLSKSTTLSPVATTTTSKVADLLVVDVDTALQQPSRQQQSSRRQETLGPNNNGTAASTTTTTTTTLAATQQSTSTSKYAFNIYDPVWPLQPPSTNNNNRKRCHITFRDPAMSICHVMPWTNFGDALGPPIVKRILSLVYPGCSMEQIPVHNLLRCLTTRSINNWTVGIRHRECSSAAPNHNIQTCLMTVGSLWRMMEPDDHVWGTGAAFETGIRHRCCLWNQHAQHATNRVDGKSGGGGTVHVHASRGPLSAQEIAQHCPYTWYEHDGSGDGGDEGLDHVKTTTIRPPPMTAPNCSWALRPPDNNHVAAGSSQQQQNRRPDTAAIAQRQQQPGGGDAGFLVPYLFPEYRLHDKQQNTQKKKKKLCLLPHYQDRKRQAFRNAESIHKDSVTILSVQQSWENLTMTMQTDCHAVVSSSLHGIVLAEALGIPNRRVRVSNVPGDFKFHDVYANYHSKAREPPYLASWKAAKNDLQQPMTAAERDAFARRIVRTFPLHLFQRVDDDDDADVGEEKKK